MTPEEKKLLEQIADLSEENNRLLRKIRNTGRWSLAYNLIYWIVIIGISLGAYYYIQPYIDQLQGVYSGAKGTVKDVQNISGLLKNLE